MATPSSTPSPEVLPEAPTSIRWPGRDLTERELWEFSLARSHVRRRAASNPPRLPQARRAGVSLVVAAVAAAAPAKASAETRASTAAKVQTWSRGVLHLGDRGAAVARLQRALGIPADGIFGRQTLAAVRAFQQSHGLVVDGIVGPRTWAALGSAPTTPTGTTRPAPTGETSSTLRLGSRGEAVARLQRALGIPADGIFGRQTLAAVRAFQQSHGLVADGVVGPATWAALTGTSGSASPSPSSPSSAALVAVQAARSALGTPYAWGGNGPASFDCSGLVVWSFRRAGVELPRTSYMQYLAGRPVALSAIQPGDLVFFSADGPGASHVGIAVSATSVISATSSGVREHPIGGSYWGSYYLGARRVT